MVNKFNKKRGSKMKKFECKVCGTNCRVTVNHGNIMYCPYDKERVDWHEVKEDSAENAQTAVNSEQLQKLTVEVFDRPDCPEWANYAVVNCDGRLTFFSDKPKFEGEDYGCWSCSYSKYKHIDNAVFDASDWKNSMIKRPVKELPDWVKVGNLVYCSKTGNYGEIKTIKDNKIYLRLINTDEVLPVKLNMVLKNGRPARKRPFNEAEMKALVGKILTHKQTGDLTLVTDFINEYDKDLDYHYSTVFAFGENYTDGDLMDDCTIDGKPCYVLEHLEKGEWVE
jgi:hypothetical protein